MSKKYDGLAMLVSVIWWIGGLCVIVGAALHAGDVGMGMAMIFGGLGLMFGNVQMYLFVEIARDVNEMKHSLRNGIDKDNRQYRVKIVKNRMKITKKGETEQ
ncbi:MAG: hypothetical protein WCQ59_09100 [Candidatus Cloacimonadaceae bacterium]